MTTLKLKALDAVRGLGSLSGWFRCREFLRHAKSDRGLGFRI